MAQIIRLKRHLGVQQAPTPAQVSVGELAYNRHSAAGAAAGPDDLWIGDGVGAHLLVGAARQVELAGTQTISGVKTFSAMPSIAGGANGNVLTTNGTGTLSWTAPVQVGTPLTLKGEFNATTNLIENAVAPLAAGAVPAGSAANEGFVLIVNTEGTVATGNAPHEHMAVGDWIVSTGTTGWIHINLHFAIVAASNVAINAITGMTGVTDTQAALEFLRARNVVVSATQPATPVTGDQWLDITVPASPVLKVYNSTAFVPAVPPAAAATVVADQVSILGDGAATGTGANGPLNVALVDGGTYV